MIVHTNSWHYRLLRAFEVTVYGIDSCTYRRKLLVLLFAITSFSAFTLYAVGDFIGWLFGCLFGTCADPNVGSAVVIISLIVVAIIAAVAGIHKLHSEWRNTHPIDPEAPPSFVSQSYHQIRDKFCSKVEIRH